MIKIFNTLVLFLVSLNIYSIEVLEVEILDSYQLKKEFPGKLPKRLVNPDSVEVSGKNLILTLPHLNFVNYTEESGENVTVDDFIPNSTTYKVCFKN